MFKLTAVLLASIPLLADGPVSEVGGLWTYRSCTPLATLRQMGIPVSEKGDPLLIVVRTKNRETEAIRVTVEYDHDGRRASQYVVLDVTRFGSSAEGSVSASFRLPGCDAFQRVSVREYTAANTVEIAAHQD